MRNYTVTATIADKLYAKTLNVFQYDYGLMLAIAGISLPDGFAVDFGNSNSAATKRVYGADGMVSIPDEYLLNGEDIHAYIRAHDDEHNSDYVLYHVHIPVVERPAISEDQITPVEHDLIDELRRTKADKADTVLETTLSCGRMAGYVVGDYSIAFGYNVVAMGHRSVAFGDYTKAMGDSSMAIGTRSHAIGDSSFAGGADTKAVNDCSFAIGEYSVAYGEDSFAAGYNTKAIGKYSVALGEYAQALGYRSLAIGDNTISGDDSFVIGKHNWVQLYNYPLWAANTQYHVGDKVRVPLTGDFAYIPYECTTDNTQVVFCAAELDPDNPGHMITYWREINPTEDHVFVAGNGSGMLGPSNAFAVGWDGAGHFKSDVYVKCNADSTGGEKLISQSNLGDGNTASGNYAFAGAGMYCTASGMCATAFGMASTAAGQFSHARGGGGATATGRAATAIGSGVRANGDTSFALGMGSTANGVVSAAVGSGAVANGQNSVALGGGTQADGMATVAIGMNNYVEDYVSTLSEWVPGEHYVPGNRVKRTLPNPDYDAEENNEVPESIVIGYECIYETSEVDFNEYNWNTNITHRYAFIVGNGTFGQKSNAAAFEWTGDMRFAGDVYVNCSADSSGGIKLIGLPAYTAQDEGKVLKIVSGVPTWVSET